MFDQQVPIRDHDLARRQSRRDHFFDELRPAGHVKQHLGPHRQGHRLAVLQDAAQAVAQRGSAGVAAGDDVEPALLEPAEPAAAA